MKMRGKEIVVGEGFVYTVVRKIGSLLLEKRPKRFMSPKTIQSELQTHTACKAAGLPVVNHFSFSTKRNVFRMTDLTDGGYDFVASEVDIARLTHNELTLLRNTLRNRPVYNEGELRQTLGAVIVKRSTRHGIMLFRSGLLLHIDRHGRARMWQIIMMESWYYQIGLEKLFAII